MRRGNDRDGNERLRIPSVRRLYFGLSASSMSQLTPFSTVGPFFKLLVRDRPEGTDCLVSECDTRRADHDRRPADRRRRCASRRRPRGDLAGGCTTAIITIPTIRITREADPAFSGFGRAATGAGGVVLVPDHQAGSRAGTRRRAAGSAHPGQRHGTWRDVALLDANVFRRRTAQRHRSGPAARPVRTARHLDRPAARWQASMSSTSCSRARTKQYSSTRKHNRRKRHPRQ